ncbi:hypothetical protein B0H10DRAFT_1957953 [Mycena sp. CBHHK59/15]|nr:hypothetical protein B0H10DRAFT_1957953 [Mycena sp. CBHHK59/15]
MLSAVRLRVAAQGAYGGRAHGGGDVHRGCAARGPRPRWLARGAPRALRTPGKGIRPRVWARGQGCAGGAGARRAGGRSERVLAHEGRVPGAHVQLVRQRRDPLGVGHLRVGEREGELCEAEHAVERDARQMAGGGKRHARPLGTSKPPRAMCKSYVYILGSFPPPRQVPSGLIGVPDSTLKAPQNTKAVATAHIDNPLNSAQTFPVVLFGCATRTLELFRELKADRGG